ncbi:MAG: twin-arginine translocase subunit TatC [Eubacterium sp.]|nr:twin-arginine translocase subunit TatC [Eubacterium sp.]
MKRPMADPSSGEKIRRWLDKPDEPMEAKPLMFHLKALRRTIIFCIIVVVAAVLAVFFLGSSRLIHYVTRPLLDRNINVIYTNVSEGFTAQMKVSFIAGLAAASPLVFAAVWLFIRPGLLRKERITAFLYLLVAAVLFVLGIFFAYRFVFFLAVNFFVQTGNQFARPMLSLGTYINFLFGFLPPFGIMFQLPIVIVWLTRLGLVTTAQLRSARKFVILAIFTIAAILTPPDVISQVMLGGPLLVLYEVGILCSILAKPGNDL